jgi:hypothetical protein
LTAAAEHAVGFGATLWEKWPGSRPVRATTLLTSTVVAAVVAGLISFATQRYLLERKATIDYELPAKQRLYQALGPLRLQLIFASRDVVRRVTSTPERTRFADFSVDPGRSSCCA